jgi:competence protein ComEC
LRTPALYALILFIGGILLAVNTALPAMAYLGVAVVSSALAVIVVLVHKPRWGRALICLAIVAAGAFLTELQTQEFPSNHVSRFAAAGQMMTISGTVLSEPDIRPSKTFLTVQVDSLRFHDRIIGSCGRLRLQIQEPTSAFGYRDRLRFTTYVNEPLSGRNPGAFDYRRYLAIRQISAIATVNDANRITLVQSGSGEPFVRAIIAPIRSYISSTFERFLPAGEAAVMKGFLIGDVRYISADVYQRFRDTGTLHVLAASGANVGYVVAALLVGIRLIRLPRQYRVYLLIAGVVVFSFLACNQPSVVRAAVMAVVALIGRALYRDTNWVNNISVAGLIILAFRPLYLYDLGWQLSFGAAFALILFMPAVEKFIPQPKNYLKKITRYFLMILYGSIIAQLGVMPVLIYNFNTVPLVSFLANLVIVPLVGIASTLGILLVFLSAIPLVSTFTATVLGLVLKMTLAGIDFFHALPIPQLKLAAPALLLIIAYYLALQLIFTFVSTRRIRGFFAVLLLVSIGSLIWMDILDGRKPEAEITFLDTRETTTIFIEQAGGRTSLITGGDGNGRINYGEVTILPFLLTRGVRHLDEVCAAVGHDDNLISLRTVLTGIGSSRANNDCSAGDPDWPANLVTPVDSITVFSSGNVAIGLLTGVAPVQSLNNLPAKLQVVAADWRYLKQEAFADFVKALQVETLILTNYPNLYASREQLNILRRKLPGIHVLSVLESGGIILQIDRGRHRILAPSHS